MSLDEIRKAITKTAIDNQCKHDARAEVTEFEAAHRPWVRLRCPECGWTVQIPREDWDAL